jgi:hypothetical protein
MKCKHTTGRSFKGLIAYMQKDDAEFISSSATDQKSFMVAAARLRASRPDCTTPVLHFSLRLPPAERLNSEQWQSVAVIYLDRLGLAENEFFCVRHPDAQGDHIHICASKISHNGKLWDTNKSALRGMKICEDLELEFNLTITKSLEKFRDESGKRKRDIQSDERRMIVRTSKIGDRRKEAIAKKIAAKKSINNGDQNAHTNTSTGVTNAIVSSSGKRKSAADKQTFFSDEKENFGARKAGGRFRKSKFTRLNKQDFKKLKRDENKVEANSIVSFSFDKNGEKITVQALQKTNDEVLIVGKPSPTKIQFLLDEAAQDEAIELFSDTDFIRTAIIAAVERGIQFDIAAIVENRAEIIAQIVRETETEQLKAIFECAHTDFKTSINAELLRQSRPRFTDSPAPQPAPSTSTTTTKEKQHGNEHQQQKSELRKSESPKPTTNRTRF